MPALVKHAALIQRNASDLPRDTILSFPLPTTPLRQSCRKGLHIVEALCKITFSEVG